jgi:hypothetical protein
VRVAKYLAPLAAFAVVLAGAASRPAEETWLVVSGDSKGFLSPCGCTKPMTGGIKRRVAAIRLLTVGKNAVVVEAGTSIGSRGRQQEIKLETLAECLSKVRAIMAVSPEDATPLGRGVMESAFRLSGNRMVTASLRGSSFPPVMIEGGLAVSSVTPRADQLASALGETPVPLKDATEALIREAEAEGVAPVVVLDGDRDAATQLAMQHPKLRVIIYRFAGDPPSTPLRVGPVTLISAGERGRFVVRVRISGETVDSYSMIKLGPEVQDDKDAKRLYKNYLLRVEGEDLLGNVPRIKSDPFAGSRACRSCHAKTFTTWSKTRHAGALKTLEKDGHAKDPECVPCHVVGLDQLGGFVSRQKTPNLADVGCESCHGPGANHSRDPYKFKLPKLGEKSCLKCHTTETSPNFDFKTYWAKIKHQ